MDNRNEEREEEAIVPLNEPIERVVYNDNVVLCLNASQQVVRVYRIS